MVGRLWSTNNGRPVVDQLSTIGRPFWTPTSTDHFCSWSADHGRIFRSRPPALKFSFPVVSCFTEQNWVWNLGEELNSKRISLTPSSSHLLPSTGHNSAVASLHNTICRLEYRSGVPTAQKSLRNFLSFSRTDISPSQ